MIRKIINLLIGMGSLAILTASCQPAAVETDMRVDMATFLRGTQGNEKILLSNCESNIEMTQTLGTVTSIRKTIKIASVGTSLDGSEHEISSPLELQLEIEVDNAYKQIYINANSRVEGVKLTIPQGYQITFIIQWLKYNYSESVAFSYDKKVYRVPYLYELDIPDLIYQEKSVCAGSIESTATELSPTPPDAASTIEPTGYTLVLKTNSLLYNGPQMAFGALSLQKRLKGEKLTVVARNPKGDWFLVETSDKLRGWIYSSWAKFDFSPEVIPIAADIPLAPTIQPSQTPNYIPPGPSYP